MLNRGFDAIFFSVHYTVPSTCAPSPKWEYCVAVCDNFGLIGAYTTNRNTHKNQTVKDSVFYGLIVTVPAVRHLSLPSCTISDPAQIKVAVTLSLGSIVFYAIKALASTFGRTGTLNTPIMPTVQGLAGACLVSIQCMDIMRFKAEVKATGGGVGGITYFDVKWALEHSRWKGATIVDIKRG